MTAYFPPTIGLNELNVALPWVLAALALMQAKLTRSGNAEAASRIYVANLVLSGAWILYAQQWSSLPLLIVAAYLGYRSKT